MTPVQLPEVPTPNHVGGWPPESYYTIAQLREYATEAVMADRRLISARVADLPAWIRSGNNVPADLPFVFRERWHKIVADIRALETTITPSETNSER